MLSRRITAAARPLAARALQPAARPVRTQIRCLSQADVEDPDMNGGYINPPRVKRQFRDPYGDWWDKQERRNYGEPVHEDNDILGIFSPEEYTHFTPGWGAVLFGTFVATVLGFSAVVSHMYPDKASVPKTYPDGLEAELGGPNALRARKHGEDQY
ncbi:uncharacterized protein K452DRAFT_299902 [Aplosporella prunicola CBS 121167]|uniref:NADH dehydrogenase [ubiquinone] 1 beta subcomplex subunit 8, mitochondrial n=1 Tax=Aplosporella prunicola CBS 121167 TaxID=1176127 RepID=A0A6A6B7P7_9PEZI|nr:uncharacterized protein K452DRAFT_299902 [Aplosporella prunicola CBS 121167]KAF2139926.1 hypothetical protein K452DRAFT_299902 [Aplosporella prunicola CBS 121167]